MAIHGSEGFIWCIPCPNVEEVPDERPSRRPGREWRAAPPDKTANEVQCKTDKGDIKDADPHDVDRRMKPFCRRGSADGYDLTSPCKSAFICGSGLHSPNKIHSRKDQGQQAIWTPCSASNFDDSVARSCRRRSGTLRVYKSVVTR